MSDTIDFQPINNPQPQQQNNGIDFQPIDQSASSAPTVDNSLANNWQVVKAAVGMANSVPRPWDVARQYTLDPVAQKASDIGLATGYPNTGAAIGTAIKISPEILSAYTSLKGMYNSANPILKGITNTPQEIGQQMGAGEQAAGINPQLPVRSGTMARFPKTNPDVVTVTPEGTAIPGGTPMSTIPDVTPTQYPKNTNALLNHIENRITQFGDQINPQELSDYKKILPEMFNKGEVVRGTPQYAMASKLNSQIGDLYNKAIPGRDQLNQAYSVSKTLHPDIITPLQNYAQKYGKQALKEAIAVAVGDAVASRFFK